MSTTPMARTAAQAAPPRKDKKAGTHQATHSIRAKAASSGVGGRAQDKGKGRDAGLSGNSKVVYKALLESPLNVKWCVQQSSLCPKARISGLTCPPDHPLRTRRPSLPAHLQETVVHTLCSMLAGAAEHHLTQGRLNRKDKPVDPKRGTRRNRANPKTASNLTQAQTDSPAANAEGGASRPAEGSSSTETGSKEPAPGNTSKDKTPKPGRPPILDHIVLGINENTNALSANPRSTSKAAPPAVPVAPVTETAPVATTSTAAPVPRSPDDALKYVFVCLADINPTSLVAHIPAMVAGFNGRAKASGAADSRGVRVMTLAKGAEALLAQAFGIRRAAVVGVKVRSALQLVEIPLRSDASGVYVRSGLVRRRSLRCWMRWCLSEFFPLFWSNISSPHLSNVARPSTPRPWAGVQNSSPLNQGRLLPLPRPN